MRDAMPKISIILPCYNVSQYVGECLDSILKQSLRETEIVCVDDKSTDNTLDVLYEYAQKDSRIKVIAKDKNEGAGKTKNIGLNAAEGIYVCFMDPDDYYPEDTTLEKLYSAATENNVKVAGGNLIGITPENQYLEVMAKFSESKLCEYMKEPFCYGYTRFIYDREFLVQNGLGFPDYLRYQDPPFLVKAMALAKQYYTITDIVYVYRINYKTITWTERKASDVFMGISDILQTSQEYGIGQLYIDQFKIFWGREIANILEQTSSFESVKSKVINILDSVNADIFNQYLGQKLEYRKCYCELIKADKNLCKKWKKYIKWPSLLTKICHKSKDERGGRHIYLFGICVLNYKKKEKMKFKEEVVWLLKKFIRFFYRIQNNRVNILKVPVCAVRNKIPHLYYFIVVKNFGDLLNVDLFKFFNKNMEHAINAYDSDILAIGSLLQCFVLDRELTLKEKYYSLISRPLIVYGSGFIEDDNKCYPIKRMDVRAVRGYITLERLKKMHYVKIAKNVAIGDPGILISKMFDVSRVEKKYDLGIIPHYVDKDNPLLQKISVKNSVVLDINKEPSELIYEIAACKNIISSAMHGLIAADSLGIPNIRMVLGDKIIGGDYKYNDYYSAFGIKEHQVLNLNEKGFTDADLPMIAENYVITKAQIEKIQEDLIKSFPYDAAK